MVAILDGVGVLLGVGVLSIVVVFCGWWWCSLWWWCSDYGGGILYAGDVLCLVLSKFGENLFGNFCVTICFCVVGCYSATYRQIRVKSTKCSPPSHPTRLHQLWCESEL